MSRIVQLTDTHVVEPGQRAYGVVDTASALMMAVEHINGLANVTDGIDAVILTGDLTDHGTLEEYHHLVELLAPLKPPVWAVPGNHDRREPMRKALRGHAELPHEGPLNWHLYLEKFDVLGLDGLAEGQPDGVLSEASLRWLDDNLDMLKDRPVIVALHHPPFETGLVGMDQQNLQNAGAFLDIVRRYRGPIQIVCGHVHRHISTLIGGVPVMIAPAPAHAVTFDQRAGQPASLTFEPPAMLIHEWRLTGDTGHFVSHFSPIGQFGGPFGFDDNQLGSKSI
jgi:3',5'-cyclic AMP phosphodiesterase CpdA